MLGGEVDLYMYVYICVYEWMRVCVFVSIGG
jgi:hypothetical protein